MLQNLEETASEIIHYRTCTIIEENRGEHKLAHKAFNPRLDKEAKRVVFPGQTAQDLRINPATGGYDLTNSRAFIFYSKENSNMDTQDTDMKINDTNKQKSKHEYKYTTKFI